MASLFFWASLTNPNQLLWLFGPSQTERLEHAGKEIVGPQVPDLRELRGYSFCLLGVQKKGENTCVHFRILMARARGRIAVL